MTTPNTAQEFPSVAPYRDDELIAAQRTDGTIFIAESAPDTSAQEIGGALAVNSVIDAGFAHDAQGRMLAPDGQGRLHASRPDGTWIRHIPDPRE